MHMYLLSFRSYFIGQCYAAKFHYIFKLNSITFLNFLFVLFELYLVSVSKLFSSGFPGPLEESS